MLLKIDDYDFHWREKYTLETPISLPKGTKITTTAIYDNTVENVFNPANPPHTMKEGPHMFDEAYICYFEFGNSTKNANLVKV